MSVKILKNFWPVFIWAIILFVLSAVPGNVFPEIKSFWDWLGPDKIVHLIFYGILCFLLMQSFSMHYELSLYPYSIIIGTFFIGTIFGLIIEVMQNFVFTGRNGNPFDFIANMIGCILGIIAFWFIRRKKYLK